MESPKGRTSPLMGSSPYSSPNIALLLRRRILSWTRETNLETSISVRVSGKIFELHKKPLISKCGYFNKALQGSSEIELPDNFPGGSESFEMVMLFTYDYPLILDPFNVSALRCAADFLEMTEEYHHPLNLVERSDLYLNQVVFQNWDDTLIVLQKCIPLIPVSEELLIVSRCVESLAFMACMEILEPERRTNSPALSMQGLTGRNWNCEIVKERAGQDLWIKDLIALPFEFFKQIIGSLRRQGMREKYVGPIIMFYANKWVLSKKTHKFWEETSEENGIEDANTKVSTIFEGIIDLLPVEEKAGMAIPVAFYFALLSRSLSLKLSKDSKIMIHEKVVSVLHLARDADFLLPEKGNKLDSVGSCLEVETMERIVKMYVVGKRKRCQGQTPWRDMSVVADLWDRYILQIASDPSLGFERFVQLIEVIPAVKRETHDHLYATITTYLLEHTGLSSEEKSSLCNYLECRKLSQETCVHAVQNNQMPLRLIMQALFLQQLHTHQTVKDCSDSFRYVQASELAITGTLTPNSASPYDGCPPSTSLSNKEYDSASFRIQTLEKEIMSLKKSLQCENSTKVPSFRVSGLDGSSGMRRRKPLGQVRGCIGFGSTSWGSQRRCAGRILKLFRRIAMLGKGKGKGMMK